LPFLAAFRKLYSHPARKHIVRRQVKQLAVKPLAIVILNPLPHPLYRGLPDMFSFECPVKPLNVAVALRVRGLVKGLDHLKKTH
jgi:hypothetical protein